MKQMKISYILILLCLSMSINAKEVFSKEHILNYLNLNNPFVYTALGQEYIYKEKEKYQEGNFDTSISIDYEKKDYPLSDSEYIRTGISKPIENGMEFSLDYRRAEGTQEYNNITTSDQGEMLVGVKIPVFAVANNINEAKANLYSARLDTNEMQLKSQDNLRLLYFKIVASYYTLIHHKQSNDLVLELLNNAKKRVSIIRKRVDAGSIARLSLLEVRQQVINRKQRLLSKQNAYQNALEIFVQYLGISPEQFTENFTLSSLQSIQDQDQSQELSLKIALENRPDIKAFSTKIKKLNLQNELSSIQQYPDFDIGIYGVHDFEYQNGFKVTLGMNFPLQRRKYTSKILEIKKSIQNTNKEKEQKVLRIQTSLKIIHNSINTLKQNIENSQLEVSLLEQIEGAEYKKYVLGLSNLFMLNQREIYTLQVKKKLLKYKLDYLLLLQSLNKEMGYVPEFSSLL